MMIIFWISGDFNKVIHEYHMIFFQLTYLPLELITNVKPTNKKLGISFTH